MTTGEIPQSQALKEALPDSLGELMSRDPEGYSQQDLGVVVAAMRAQRERLQAGIASGEIKQQRVPKAAVSLKSPVSNADDLGL